jgi:hypothetical protein
VASEVITTILQERKRELALVLLGTGWGEVLKFIFYRQWSSTCLDLDNIDPRNCDLTPDIVMALAIGVLFLLILLGTLVAVSLWRRVGLGILWLVAGLYWLLALLLSFWGLFWLFAPPGATAQILAMLSMRRTVSPA